MVDDIKTDYIDTINPEGQAVSIPINMLNDALGVGYKLPSPIKQADISTTPEYINVVNPEGMDVSIPHNMLKDALDNGYVLSSTPNAKEYIDKVKHDKELISHTVLNLPEMTGINQKEHLHDDIYSNDKFKMEDVNGNKFEISKDNFNTAYAAGLRFQDKNFQALLDANINHINETPGAGKALAVAIGGGGGLTFGVSNLLRPTHNSYSLAEKLAEDYIVETQHPTTKAVAGVAGAILPMLATGGAGLLGEGAAAVKAGAATKAAILAGEEAPSIGRAAAAFAASKAVEGLVITSPQAAAQLIIDKDPKLAAETLGLGAGLSLGLGIAGKTVSLIPKAIEASKPATIDKALTEIGLTEESSAKLGNAEQKENFVKTMLEHGAKEDMSRAGIQKTMMELSEGSAMVPVLEKLDPYLAKDMKMQIQMQSVINETAIQQNISESLATKVSEDLAKAGGKDGNLNLTEMQKFISKLGEDMRSLGTSEDAAKAFVFQDTVKKSAMTHLTDMADHAAQQAPTKLLSDWINVKSTAELASQFHQQLLTAPKESFDPAFKIIKQMLHYGTHKGLKYAGASVGGLPGLIAGEAVSKVTSPVIEKTAEMLHHYIMNPENPTKLGSYLQKKISSPALTSYLIMDSVHSTTKKIEEVPDFIRQMAVKGGASFATKESPIKQILGSQANGLSKQQQFERLSHTLSALQGNPQLKEEHLNAVSAALMKDHSLLAQQLKDDYNKKLEFLYQHLPKDPNANKPFSPKSDWKPSKAEMDDFERTLKIAQNPFVLLDYLKSGKITSKDVATASVLNPAILQHIQEKIATEAHSGKANLNYQQKLNASLLMGQAMDNSLNAIPQLQTAFGSPPNAGGPIQTSSGKGGSKLNQDKMPNAKSTLAQRIANK